VQKRRPVQIRRERPQPIEKHGIVTCPTFPKMGKFKVFPLPSESTVYCASGTPNSALKRWCTGRGQIEKSARSGKKGLVVAEDIDGNNIGRSAGGDEGGAGANQEGGDGDPKGVKSVGVEGNVGYGIDFGVEWDEAESPGDQGYGIAED